MLDRRLVNRPGELDLPVDFKQIPNSKHAIQITFTEPVEPESPAIDFGNFKNISEAAKNSYSSKDFGMLELPPKDRLLSIIPETKSALEDQSLMASLHTESPTSPPQKQPVEISNFAPSKLLKDEMDSAGDYPVSIVMSSLMNQQAKEKNSFDAAEEAKKGIKNLHVKEPFGKPMSGLMPTVFTHSEEDQGFPQRKLRMCSAENEITRFLSSSKQHILSNTVKKLKATDTIRDSGEFEGNSLSGSSCSPSNRRGQGLPIPKYNFLNVPDGSGNTEGPQSSRFERRRKSSCAILETQDKTNVEKRESSQEVKPSGESLGIPKPTNGLLKWPSITPSQIPEPDWENCSEQGVTEKSEEDSIVFSRINDTASLYPAGTEKTSKQSPSVATISLQVPYSSPKMKSRFNTRPDLQNCKPGLKVTSIAPEILLQPLSTIQMTGECSHSPDSKLLSPNISTVKSGQSPKGILTKSKPEFAGQNRIMQSGSLTTSLLVEPDKAKNSDLMDRPSNQEQLSLSTNPNHTVSDKSSQALVSSQPFRQRNPIKRSKHSFIINKANTQVGKKEEVLPQGHLTESTPFLETQQLHQTTEIDQLDQDNLESLLYQSLADKQKLAQELSKLESKISMIKSVIQKNRSRTTSKINDTEWLNIEENKTIKYSPRMNQQRFAETRANQDMRPDFAAELENDKKLLESYASQHIPSNIEGSHQFVPQRIDASKHGVQQDEHGDSSNLSNGLNSEAITHSWQSREKPHRIQRRGNGRQVHVTERERKFLVRPQQRIWLPGSEVSVEKRPRSQFKSFNTNGSVSTEKRFEVPLRNIGRSMDFTPFIRKELSRDTQVDPNLSKSINANDFSVNSKSVDTQSQVSRNLKAILGGKKSPLVKKLKQPIKQVDLLVRRDSVLVKGQEPRTNLKSNLVRGSTPIFQSFLFE